MELSLNSDYSFHAVMKSTEDVAKFFESIRKLSKKFSILKVFGEYGHKFNRGVRAIDYMADLPISLNDFISYCNKLNEEMECDEYCNAGDFFKKYKYAGSTETLVYEFIHLIKMFCNTSHMYIKITKIREFICDEHSSVVYMDFAIYGLKDIGSPLLEHNVPDREFMSLNFENDCIRREEIIELMHFIFLLLIKIGEKSGSSYLNSKDRYILRFIRYLSDHDFYDFRHNDCENFVSEIVNWMRYEIISTSGAVCDNAHGESKDSIIRPNEPLDLSLKFKVKELMNKRYLAIKGKGLNRFIYDYFCSIPLISKIENEGEICCRNAYTHNIKLTFHNDAGILTAFDIDHKGSCFIGTSNLKNVYELKNFDHEMYFNPLINDAYKDFVKKSFAVSTDVLESAFVIALLIGKININYKYFEVDRDEFMRIVRVRFNLFD